VPHRPFPKTNRPRFSCVAAPATGATSFWALEYFEAMLMAGVPNVEMHLYGNGRHTGDPLPDGGRVSGGLTDV
jgi:hypothetical protein